MNTLILPEARALLCQLLDSIRQALMAAREQEGTEEFSEIAAVYFHPRTQWSHIC